MGKRNHFIFALSLISHEDQELRGVHQRDVRIQSAQPLPILQIAPKLMDEIGWPSIAQ